MAHLTRFIRSRSISAEFQFVVLMTFGLLLVREVLFLLQPSASSPIDRPRLLQLIAIEIPVLVLVGWVLSVRGWTWRGLGLAPTAGQTLLGPVFTLATLGIWIGQALVVSAFFPQLVRASTHSALVSKEIGLVVILVVSIVNGFFEELFLCGYIVTVLKRCLGAPFAIALSTGLRMALHVYQGPTGLANMAGMGLLFAYWFARSGKLWPLIVAHILLDLIGLSLAN